MKTLLFLGIILFPLIHFAQVQSDNLDDFHRVKVATLTWADATLYEYNEPRFEHFSADYTEAYLIATLRIKSIERSIKSLTKTYDSGYYKDTDENYRKSLADLKSRKEEAELNSVGFQPKVETFQIAFWANIKLDSGIHNYIKHHVVLDNDFNVISAEVMSSIGENKNASILYRSMDN